MNPHDLWAKLVPLSPDKEPVNCNINVNINELKVEGKWKIFRKPTTGDTWIVNLSELFIRIGSDWLETNQEKQLLGGEMIAFSRARKLRKITFDYIFCFTDFQSKNELKRVREPLPGPSPQKLLKVDDLVPEAEITCSICLGILKRCATLGPCGHNFCGLCLLGHLRNSLLCPLCKTKIISVIKHSAFHNIIEATVKNSPNLQERSFNQEIMPLQRDLEGNVYTHKKGVFIGSIVNGKQEGKGTLVYPDGEIYQGIWKDGLAEGEGVLILTNGTLINGLWLNNKLQPDVEIKFANGNFYKGETTCTSFNKLKFNGRGLFKSHDGEIYEGDFKEDLRDGFGKNSYKSGSVYEGDFKEDLREGFGKYSYRNGAVYEGGWKRGLKEGVGQYSYKNRDEYMGHWKQGERHGYGILMYSNGDVFWGKWKNDQREGKGVLLLPNVGVYDGRWKNDKEIGQGKYTFEEENRKYEEFWEEGRPHESILTIADGTKYEAIWKKVKEVKGSCQ